MQKRSYQGRSPQGNRQRSGFRGGRRSFSGNRGRGRGAQKIDVSRFINRSDTGIVEIAFQSEHAFSDFAVEETLKVNIQEKGYVTPTPIQDKIIPHILDGRDVVGIANTGTGKTAAFLVPLINKVLKNGKEQILIMVPTRELAIQIEEELRGFTKRMPVFGVVCVGGAPIERQISGLRRQHNFVIGTPGRLKDLMERNLLHLKEFNTVVLDEADRMLDMGFIHDMRFMLSKMPTPRHTLFFSATISPEIERLIGDFLIDPIRISVKTGDTAKNVDQDIIRLEKGADKIDVLHDLLTQSDFGKVLIFGRTKHGVERLSRDLAARGLKTGSIHGDKSQSQRERALSQFKKDAIQALVATDVAARGLDITDITHVINYDIPSTYEDYVHRIGRTGRGDKKGKAITFVE
ncbi:MAG: DEAD/DEAH box helicase [Candidatus Paceibacterota bacterium]